MIGTDTPSSRRRTLRALIDGPDILVLPGVVDAMTARLATQAGFEAVFATGAGIANLVYGLPDMGIVSATQMAEAVGRIVSAGVPVMADADTGYGNALNVYMTTETYEAMGVAGIMLEDQVTPKRCGHFEGKAVIPLMEMLAKIEAFRKARRDPDLVLMARTDAIAVEGFESAIERARAYAEVGADLIFVEAPTTTKELEAIPGMVNCPVVANMVEGGHTPLFSGPELQAMGYSGVIFANAVLRAALHAARDALQVLRATGDSRLLEARMLSWDERQQLVELSRWQRLDTSLAT